MDELADLYLRALKHALTRGPAPVPPRPIHAINWKRHIVDPMQSLLARGGYRIVQAPGSHPPLFAGAPETMISLERLENVQACVEQILADDVPGDLIETGVWRGGTVIFMRALLAVHGVTDRKVWAADSFQGFPKLRRYADDRERDFTDSWGEEFLSVDLDSVRESFRRYGLLDEQVHFLRGWFSETLPGAPIESLAILRLDGDLYESTWDAITALEPKVSAGGFVIIDDYGSFEQCRRAIHDYRDKSGIDDPIERIDSEGVYWRKS
jgi:hypothetical protein